MKHKSEPAKTSSWVMVEYVNEEEILKQCWQKLPINISFQEFKHVLQQSQQRQEQKKTGTTQWMKTAWYCIHTLWMISTYMILNRRYVFTLLKYMLMFT